MESGLWFVHALGANEMKGNRGRWAVVVTPGVDVDDDAVEYRERDGRLEVVKSREKRVKSLTPESESLKRGVGIEGGYRRSFTFQYTRIPRNPQTHRSSRTPGS